MRRFWLIVLPLATSLLLLDRLTKAWALQLMGSQVLIPGQFELALLRNTHFLFYWNMPAWLVFGCIVLAVVGMVSVWWREYQQQHWFNTILVTVVLVGAASNLFDRLWYGSVVDFISIPWWSVFNLADIYIIAGVLALLYNLWHNEPVRE